jgi:predicted alpha/beta-fold hydrolase
VGFRRERLELPDGDFLDLDWVARTRGSVPREDDPLVVVLHGLEGCAQSGYALELYRALVRQGLAAVGLNFRSCSGEPNRLARLYHSGDTGDVRHVFGLLGARWPDRPLGAIGVSLGGNVLLKSLGEEGRNAPSVRRGGAAVAISVPGGAPPPSRSRSRTISPRVRRTSSGGSQG